MALPFALKKYLKGQKKTYGNSKYFTIAKKNTIFKKSSN
jgi:hypothetical protein